MKKLFGIIASLAVLFSACSSDEDKDPVVSLSGSSYTMTADGSVVVKLNVENYSGTAVNIPITLSGTAQKDVDYTVSAESFKVGGGQSAEITFIAKNNFDGDKEIIVTLGTLPSGFTNGEHKSAVISLPAKDYIYYAFTEDTYLMSQTAEPTIELRTGKAQYKATEDITIPVEIDTEGTTAVEGTNFSFEGAKEIVIKKGSSTGSVKLNWLKNEDKKNLVKLKIGQVQQPGLVAGLINAASVKIVGPIADKIVGTWVGKSFVNYDWFDVNVSWTGDLMELFPTISANDKLIISKDGIKVDMKGALKNYFREGDLEFLNEKVLVYQEEGVPVVKRTAQTVKIKNTNVFFSSSKTKIREAEVSFRVFQDSGVNILEVTIADFEPTDFLINTYGMVKEWGATPVMADYPLRYHFVEVK